MIWTWPIIQRESALFGPNFFKKGNLKMTWLKIHNPNKHSVTVHSHEDGDSVQLFPGAIGTIDPKFAEHIPGHIRVLDKHPSLIKKDPPIIPTPHERKVWEET